jgi:hypothetical protein
VFIATTLSSVRVIEYDVDSGRYLRSFIRADSGLQLPASFAFRPASPNDRNGNSLPDDCDAALCPADIGGDGQVNIDDLLAVITSWGPCPSCPADIEPAATGGDNVVNVDDMVAVINHWGPCP